MMERLRTPGRGSVWGVVLPVVATVVVLAVGLGSAVLQSLGLLPLVGEPEFTTDSYTADPLGPSVAMSMWIAAASTTLAAVVGTLTALLFVSRTRGRSLLAALGTATIPVPHLVGAATVGLLLSDAGLLSRWTGSAASRWPDLVGGRWAVAVVVEFAWKESAFVALVVSATLARRFPEYLENAAVLGAGRWAQFRHVTLPMAAPAVVSASLIVFVYTLGSYEVAWLLGPAYPEPLPVAAYREYSSIDLTARPHAMALAVVTTGIAASAAVGGALLRRRTVVWR